MGSTGSAGGPVGRTNSKSFWEQRTSALGFGVRFDLSEIYSHIFHSNQIQFPYFLGAVLDVHIPKLVAVRGLMVGPVGEWHPEFL